MKLYLFGGAETDKGKAPKLKKLLNETFINIGSKQILHIPYARTDVPREEEDIWGEGWMSRDLSLNGIELLDSRDKNDLENANDYIVFMNGGKQRDLLYKKIISSKRLYNLVKSTKYLVGESAGSSICAEYRRSYSNDEVVISKGLGLVKDTIIEAHYTEKNRCKLLREEMKEANIKYGIGIDSLTTAIIDTETYPEKFDSVGDGKVDFVRLKDL